MNYLISSPALWLALSLMQVAPTDCNANTSKCPLRGRPTLTRVDKLQHCPAPTPCCGPPSSLTSLSLQHKPSFAQLTPPASPQPPPLLLILNGLMFKCWKIEPVAGAGGRRDEEAGVVGCKKRKLLSDACCAISAPAMRLELPSAACAFAFDFASAFAYTVQHVFFAHQLHLQKLHAAYKCNPKV